MANETKLMIDIETLAQADNAAILSIGAVKFGNQKLFDEFYVEISPQSCIDVGLIVDKETIAWWMSKEADARAVLSSARKSGLPIRDALNSFTDFLMTKNIELWSQGLDFDIVKLRNAYKACGLEVPWDFWSVRDSRTIFKVFEEVIYNDRTGVYHNALDDAKTQARRLMELLQN